MSNRLHGHYYGYTEARKNLPEKTPLGKKHDRKSWLEPCPKLRAVGSPSYEASQLKKICCQCLVDIQRHRISNVFTVPLNDDFIFQTQDLRLHDDNITNVSYLVISCSRVGGIVVSIAAFQAVDPGSIPGRRNEANSTVLNMLHERLTNLFLLVYYYFYWLFLMI